MAVVLLAHAVGARLATTAGHADGWLGPRSEALRTWVGGGDRALLAAEPWRLFTSGLVHVTLAHLLVNGAALAVVGGVVESLLGARRVVVVAAAGVVGGTLLAAAAGLPRVDGASSGAFALLGAGIAVGWRWPLSDADRRLLVRGFGVVAAGNLAVSFVVPSLALSAHVGGLLVGLALGAGARPGPAGPGWTVVALLAAAVAPLGLLAAWSGP